MTTTAPPDRDTTAADARAAHSADGATPARLVLGLSLLLGTILLAFAWPASQLAPRDLPVGVVGPPPAAERVDQAATAALGEGALDVTTFTDRAAAVAALEDREQYAALVPSPEGTEVLLATAASPTVANLVRGLATGMSADGTPVRVTEVVPLTADDPHGAVFASGALPLVLGGFLAGAAIALLLGAGRRAVATALAVSAVGGLLLAAIWQGWLGGLAGSYLANAGVVALVLAAITLPVVGLRRVLGVPGVPLAALVLVLLGNPLSGVTSAPELLPTGWSELGQLLPPGAGATALRATSYFDGAGAGWPLLVLGTWALAGLALALVPRRRQG